MSGDAWTAHAQDQIVRYKNPLREESHPELLADFPYKYIEQQFFGNKWAAHPGSTAGSMASGYKMDLAGF